MYHNRLTAGADFHPIGNGLHGYYMGPRVVLSDWSYSSNDDEASYFTSSKLKVTGVFGYRWVFDPGLSVGLGFGTGFKTTLREVGDSELVDESTYSGTAWGGEFSLGWAF